MLAEGYEKLTADLKALRQERPRIVDAIEEARAHGDLSENAEYHAAKERQGQVEAQIAELEDKVSRAQIIDPASLSGNRVIFCATVIDRGRPDASDIRRMSAHSPSTSRKSDSNCRTPRPVAATPQAIPASSSAPAFRSSTKIPVRK